MFNCKNLTDAIRGSIAALIACGLSVAIEPQEAQAQPQEIRIRALGIDAAAGRVEARDLLGSGGMVIRAAGDIIQPGYYPEHFNPYRAKAVGDVNGDGFTDLAVFYDSGDNLFEELFIVYGRADLSSHVDRSNIASLGIRFTHDSSLFDWARWGFGDSRPTCGPAGDVDGDGFGDFFIGVWFAVPPEYKDIQPQDVDTYSPGIVYLVYGGPALPQDINLLSPPPNLRLTRFSSTKPTYTGVGAEVCPGGGDVNGDGLIDLVISSMGGHCYPGEPPCRGRVYVLFGQTAPYTGLIDLEEIGSSLPGVILVGDPEQDSFGEVAFAGDVNGDGFDDLLIGIGLSTRSIAVLFGKPDLPGRLKVEDLMPGGYGVLTDQAEGVGDEAMQSIVPLGDVNGDGFADFAAGWSFGTARIIFGQADFDGQLYAEIIGSSIGKALSAIDYDGDGAVDLLLGAYETTVDGVSQVGRAYIVKGPFEPGPSRFLDDRLSQEPTGVLFTTELPEWLGQAARGLGDMNGDGRADILLSAQYKFGKLANHLEPGLSDDPSAYIVFGTGAGPAPLRLDEILPQVGPLEGGNEVTILGQGFQDGVEVWIGGLPAEVLRVETSARMAIQVPEGDRLGPSEVAVIRGGESVRADGLFRYTRKFYPDIDVSVLAANGKGIVIDASLSGTSTHWSKAAVLDHDGDGLGDIVIDSIDGLVIVYGREEPVESGSIMVLPFEDPPPGTARLRLSDRQSHEPFAVGDVNGDGRSDLAVLSRKDSVVTMVFGGKRFQGSLEVETLYETGGASLISVSTAREIFLSGGCDFDGDGIGDMVVCRVDPTVSTVNVVRGRTAWPPLRGLATEPVFRSSDNSLENRFGRQAALVGDIDADGFSELLIGRPGIFIGDDGKGFLVFGKADWESTYVEDLVGSGEAVEINSVKEMDSLGFFVTGIGDFDGDGVPDLALSAPGGSIEFAGESDVVFGGPELRGAPPLKLSDLADRGLRIRGEFGYDYAIGLAPAGDFNGDGRRDLLISTDDFLLTGNLFPARCFVVFGGARGMVDLGRLGENGFRIYTGLWAGSVGGTDFNGDGFDDVVVHDNWFIYVVFGSGFEASFIRGDSNTDAILDISDAVSLLNYLFLGTFKINCEDSGDANDDGILDLSDAIYILGHLFLGSPAPLPPFPAAGPDPTRDALNCMG